MIYACLHCGETDDFFRSDEVIEHVSRDVTETRYLNREGDTVDYGDSDYGDEDVTDSETIVEGVIMCQSCERTVSEFSSQEEANSALIALNLDIEEDIFEETKKIDFSEVM